MLLYHHLSSFLFRKNWHIFQNYTASASIHISFEILNVLILTLFLIFFIKSCCKLQFNYFSMSTYLPATEHHFLFSSAIAWLDSLISTFIDLCTVAHSWSSSVSSVQTLHRSFSSQFVFVLIVDSCSSSASTVQTLHRSCSSVTVRTCFHRRLFLLAFLGQLCSSQLKFL